jgi:ribulose-phosphate 3-epimerase
VIVHVEAFDEVVELSELAASLRCAGVSPGVAISPETPVDLLSGIVTSVDTVVVMTVEPGLGGSPMIGDADGRVREVREIIRSSASTAQLEVDGGMNAASIGNLRMLGVRRFVVGSAVFGSPNPRETIKALKRIGMERDAEISDYNIR